MEEVKESPSRPSRRALFSPMKRSRRPRPVFLVLLASLLAVYVALFVFPCKGFCFLSAVRNFSSRHFAFNPVVRSPPVFSQCEESGVLNTKNDPRLHVHGGPVAFGVPLAAPVAQTPPLSSPSEDSATSNASNGGVAQIPPLSSLSEDSATLNLSHGGVAQTPPLPSLREASATLNVSNGGVIQTPPPLSPSQNSSTLIVSNGGVAKTTPLLSPSEDSATLNMSNGDGATASEPPRLPPATEASAVVTPKQQQSSNLSRAAGNRHTAPSAGALTSNWPKQSQVLLQALRPTAESKRFEARAGEFFRGSGTNSPCKWRFFMTWIASLDAFGRREQLAMESLFKFHPDACLLIVSNTMDSNPGVKLLKPFVDRGFRVAAISPDFDYLFKGTPAEEWFRKLLRREVYPGEVPLGQNLSNLLRLAILYKLGGVYLDTDVILLRSFESLRNSIGVQSIDEATGKWARLNNAVLIFDKRHPLLYKFIEEFATTFDGSRWGFNGPYLVSRVVSRLGPEPGFTFTVLPPAAFYPVGWSKIGELFRGPQNKNHSQWIDDKLRWLQGGSFAVHLWNKESKGVTIEEGSVMGIMLSRSCIFCNASESTF